MEIKTWTREEIADQYPSCKVIHELVRIIEEQAEAEGKVVCSVEVNGLTLSEEDESRFSGASVSDVEKIRVSLEDTKKLVTDTVANLLQGLENTRNRCVHVADLIRENPAGKAQAEFAGLMEQVKFITDALGALKPRMRAQFQCVEQWRAAEIRNRETINELLAAFKKQDFSLVSDVLEYEVYNLMDTWSGVLGRCEFD